MHNHKKKGWSWLGMILWVLAFVALMMAWIASARPNGLFLSLPVAHLFWDALVLGVLSLGVKMHHMSGMCHGDKCGMDGEGSDMMEQ